MESYVVRVYRKGQSDPNEVAGLVEIVGTDERKAFQSFSGLVTAIRQALGVDDTVIEVKAQAHLFTEGDTILKKQQAG
jgi:hypothetical protein